MRLGVIVLAARRRVDGSLVGIHLPRAFGAVAVCGSYWTPVKTSYNSCVIVLHRLVPRAGKIGGRDQMSAAMMKGTLPPWTSTA